jgi:hypothetical protein
MPKLSLHDIRESLRWKIFANKAAAAHGYE